jgi:hypothetical protein
MHGSENGNGAQTQSAVKGAHCSASMKRILAISSGRLRVQNFFRARIYKK